MPKDIKHTLRTQSNFPSSFQLVSDKSNVISENKNPQEIVKEGIIMRKGKDLKEFKGRKYGQATGSEKKKSEKKEQERGKSLTRGHGVRILPGTPLGAAAATTKLPSHEDRCHGKAHILNVRKSVAHTWTLDPGKPELDSCPTTHLSYTDVKAMLPLWSLTSPVR